MDIIVTGNEVNQYHGTGVLLKRIFQDDSRILSIRTRNDYDGKQQFGKKNMSMDVSGFQSQEIYKKVSSNLIDLRARYVLCIPLNQEEIHIALTVKKELGKKLCTYIMDDSNIYTNITSDELMLELLEKSELRLAISPELRDAYEQKYKLKFWMLPPLVPKELIHLQKTDHSAYDQQDLTKTGSLAGNIWSQKWLDSLRKTLRGSGVKLYWYGVPSHNGLTFNEDDLRQDGLFLEGFVTEPELAKFVARYPFTILPTGTTEELEDRPEIAKLSLPSRLPFIAATSHTPIIVLGSPESAAARFVKRFEIGIVSDYNRDSFCKAIESICSPQTQMRMRQNAANLAESFSSDGIDRWVWQSLEKGEPADPRFENLMPPTRIFVENKLKVETNGNCQIKDNPPGSKDTALNQTPVPKLHSQLVNAFVEARSKRGDMSDSSLEALYHYGQEWKKNNLSK